jgi:putative membrane protein
MKLLTILGRLLAVPFWLAVLANLASPFAAPFALLLNLAGAAVFALHLLQLGLCHRRLLASPRPTRDRLPLLLFGAFCLEALPAPEALVEQLVQATRDPEAGVAQPAAELPPADGVVASVDDSAAEEAASEQAADENRAIENTAG